MLAAFTFRVALTFRSRMQAEWPRNDFRATIGEDHEKANDWPPKGSESFTHRPRFAE
jgi:hypothetical protein